MRTMYLCIVIEETALPTREEIEEIMRLSIDLAHLSPDRILLGKSSVPHKLRPFIARQVALAERQGHKFPSLAKCPFFLPTERAFEQASGEPLARHKQRYVMPETVLMDGTGGLGIDFLFMSACARQADYYEQDQLPYVAACRNLPLALSALFPSAHAEALMLHQGNSLEALEQMEFSADQLLYFDPARRTAQGQRTFLLRDIVPNPLEIVRYLAEKHYPGRLLFKLSPMMDIAELLRLLPQATHIAVMATGSEVKELLLYIASLTSQPLPAQEVPLHLYLYPEEGGEPFSLSLRSGDEQQAEPLMAEQMDAWLYLPHAALLKAGAFKWLSAHYGVRKLAKDSHLYTSVRRVDGFPGRIYHVEEVIPWKSRTAKELKKCLPEADLTVKNFPLSRADLYRTLGIRPGSAHRIIATRIGSTPILAVVTSDK